MPHLTKVPFKLWGGGGVTRLEKNAVGFKTSQMGDCAWITFLWDPAGINYQKGISAHISGGLANIAEFGVGKELYEATRDAPAGLIVLVWGSTEPTSLCKQTRSKIRRGYRQAGWRFTEATTKGGWNVVTNKGHFLSGEEYGELSPKVYEAEYDPWE